MQVFRSVEVKCTDVLNRQLRRVPVSLLLPPLPLCPSLPLVPSSVYRPRDRGPEPCAIINQPRPAGRSYCRVGEFMATIHPAASRPRLRLREDCPGAVISLWVREGRWVAGDHQEEGGVAGRGRRCPSDDGGHPPAAAVPVIALPGQVGGGHEHEALIGAAVLQQDLDTLLAGGLPGIGQCRVPVRIAGHDVHPVLRRQQSHVSVPGEEARAAGDGDRLPGIGGQPGSEVHAFRQECAFATQSPSSVQRKWTTGDSSFAMSVLTLQL